MNNYNEFALERARATRSVQNEISASWVWDERTVAQWDAAIAALVTQAEVAQDAEADVDGARGNLNVAMATLAERARQVLALAKIKYRKVPATYALFAKVRFESDGRSAILEDALAVESGWEQADAAWVPLQLPGPVALTLAFYKTSREAALVLVKNESDAGAAWVQEEKILNGLGRALTDANVAWYGAATTLFAEGTTEGDLIRSQVPTTYSPPSDGPVPGLAGFVTIESAGPGDVLVIFAAPEATSYNIYRKGPGEADFTEVEHEVASGEHHAMGLPAGTYTFKGEGVNDAGTGAMSEELSVDVT